MRDKSVLEFIDVIKENLKNFKVEGKIEEFGKVVSISDGIAKITGLDNVKMAEVVEFENGVSGIVLNLNQDCVDVVIFSQDSEIEYGMNVKRTGKALSIPVGKEMLGRVVDPFGKPLDGKGPIRSNETRPIESPAPGILDRKSVHEPLQTGIKIIDSLIPIGRGQRQLIIGDRQTGKTAIAIDTIINQGNINNTKEYDNEMVFCVYVAIGQKNSTIAKIVKDFEDRGILKHVVIVVATSADNIASQFLAPYAGCAIGEYFRDNGMHSLVVYDDLSKHAVAYRQISLLLRRPPAREAYPGDVFYLHSRLLERAAKMSPEKGSGSLTALPIIETQAGDISAYIPTNVISITDGQIFLESELFYKGFRPAINIGLSVSRVGSAAQTKAMKKVSGRLKSDLAQYRELEAFSKFGSDIDDDTFYVLERGRKVSKILTQDQYKPHPMQEEAMILFAITKDFINKIHIDHIKDFELKFIDHVSTNHNDILTTINSTSDIKEELSHKISSILEIFVEDFNKDKSLA